MEEEQSEPEPQGQTDEDEPENAEEAEISIVFETEPTLLTLPPVVTERIVRFLSPSALKIMRSTSKPTKNWVDKDPDALLRLPLRVKNHATSIRAVTKSRVKWNNLILIIVKDKPISNVFPFLNLRRDCIRRVKIEMEETKYSSDNPISPLQLFDLIMKLSPKIEYFSFVGDIICRNRTWTDHPRFTSQENQDTLRTNLRGVKRVEFQHGSRKNPTPSWLVDWTVEDDLSHLSFIWRNCPNADTFILPISTTFETVMPPNLDEAMEPGRFLDFRPLMDILNGIDQTQTRNSEIRIELTTEWFHSSIIENYARSSRPSQSWDLVKIAEVCFTKSARLFNVPIDLLPKSSTLNQKMWLEECVGNILVKNLNEKLQNYFVPPGCPVSVCFGIADGHHRGNQDYTQFEIPDTGLNLVYIEWNQFAVSEGRESVYAQLFEKCRPSVVELVLDRSDFITDPKKPKLSDVFPNLKKIRLANHRYSSAGYLDGLLELEDITLEKSYISESFFEKLDCAGYQKPYMPKFKNLKHLRILKCDLHRLSDKTFLATFRNLKLKTFICTGIGSANKTITFKDGISQLNTKEDRLADTLETLECTLPPNLPEDEDTIIKFLKGFKNLHQATIHFKKAGVKSMTTLRYP